ncbi:hypothetical protein LOK49_LG11G00131, partial [Camellia lanceoleosa]
MHASELMVYSDSQLVVNQVSGVYEAKDDRMAKYQALVRDHIKQFQAIRLFTSSLPARLEENVLGGMDLLCVALLGFLETGVVG